VQRHGEARRRPFHRRGIGGRKRRQARNSDQRNGESEHAAAAKDDVALRIGRKIQLAGRSASRSPRALALQGENGQSPTPAPRRRRPGAADRGSSTTRAMRENSSTTSARASAPWAGWRKVFSASVMFFFLLRRAGICGDNMVRRAPETSLGAAQRSLGELEGGQRQRHGLGPGARPQLGPTRSGHRSARSALRC